jgi:ParB-like chromosome segregation protein Spo0J
MQEIMVVKINEVKSNPNNPRLIKDEKFKQLVKSIQDFPDMLKLRPIVVNDDMVVLGGNMRLKACKEAGLKEVSIIKASSLTEEQQKEFIIKDNLGYGEWDWDSIANEWDVEQLNDWGLDIPNFNSIEYTDKNKELDIDDIEDKMVIRLNYTEEEYFIVKDYLSKLASTPEMAVWKLIGNE